MMFFSDSLASEVGTPPAIEALRAIFGNREDELTDTSFMDDCPLATPF